MPVVDPEKLQNAGTNYPVHILHPVHPAPAGPAGAHRVKDLARVEITAERRDSIRKGSPGRGSATCRRLDYNLEIDPPPYRRRRRGPLPFQPKARATANISPPSMAVLLRYRGRSDAAGGGLHLWRPETEVPEPIYAVRDSNSHGMGGGVLPRLFDWVPFEPTPGQLPCPCNNGSRRQPLRESSWNRMKSSSPSSTWTASTTSSTWIASNPRRARSSDRGSDSSGAIDRWRETFPPWIWVLVVPGGRRGSSNWRRLVGIPPVSWLRPHTNLSHGVCPGAGAWHAVGGLGGGTGRRTPYQFGDRLKSAGCPLHRESTGPVIVDYLREGTLWGPQALAHRAGTADRCLARCALRAVAESAFFGGLRIL